MGIAVLWIEPFSDLGQFSLPAVFQSAYVWCAQALPPSAAAVLPTDGSQLSLSSVFSHNGNGLIHLVLRCAHSWDS